MARIMGTSALLWLVEDSLIPPSSASAAPAAMPPVTAVDLPGRAGDDDQVPLRHVLLALTVITLGGVNFLALHFSLEQFPPMFLVGLRFLILAAPALLFVRWPGVKIRYLIGYGLGFGTLQFFGLYLGMAAGFPAGLASIVLQASAPFTVLLGALLLKEPLTRRRGSGVAIAVAGLAVVG